MKPEKHNLPDGSAKITTTTINISRRRRIGFPHFRPESEEQKILILLQILSKIFF